MYFCYKGSSVVCTPGGKKLNKHAFFFPHNTISSFQFVCGWVGGRYKHYFYFYFQKGWEHDSKVQQGLELQQVTVHAKVELLCQLLFSLFGLVLNSVLSSFC